MLKPRCAARFKPAASVPIPERPENVQTDHEGELHVVLLAEAGLVALPDQRALLGGRLLGLVERQLALVPAAGQARLLDQVHRHYLQLADLLLGTAGRGRESDVKPGARRRRSSKPDTSCTHHLSRLPPDTRARGTYVSGLFVSSTGLLLSRPGVPAPEE